MRLIDADKLLEHLYNKQTERCDVALEIAEFPTVDAVPVVRCKDCKYAERLKCGSLACVFLDNPSIPEDYFCADGERRSGDAY